MVLTESEPSRCSEQRRKLIDRVAVDVRPGDPLLAEWFARYRREHATRLAFDVSLVERFATANARVLEYGAVPLLLTAALSTLGYRVSALDVAPERFSETIARLDLDVTRCDVETEEVPFPAETFDLVLFNELFEHLRINPIFTMREVRRVLKSDGWLLLSTPNMRSFRGIRNLVVHNQGHAASGGVYAQYEKLETLGHMGHVREYTTREVSEFLSELGFQPHTIVFRGGHGFGLAGIAERTVPRLRPFFTLAATKNEASGR